jgi:hypothetical protein
MERNIDLNEMTDGRLYTANDMVKADAGGCEGCFACCTGMGKSIILDPLDVHRICSYFRVPFEALLADHVELNVVDGVILPNMKMVGEDEKCIFLNEEGRCGIHKIRPGFCRLFPLGRLYENRGFKYILQTKECQKQDRQKVKIKKWLDTPDLKAYEQFVTDWHYFLKDVAASLDSEQADAQTRKQVTIYILKQFYMRGFEENIDFYRQFADRLEEVKAILLK